MICYKDTTFCNSPNCVNECGRKLTDEIVDAAIMLNMPLSIGYFCGLPHWWNEDIKEADKCD